MSLKSFIQKINQWFFGEHSTWGLSLFRIALGFMLIQKFVLLFPDLKLWYTENGVLSLTASLRLIGTPRLNLFETFQNFDSEKVAYAMWAVALTTATTFCLGLWTRTSALILYVVTVSFDHRNSLVLHGGDTLYRVVLFWMIFAKSNGYYSLDSILAQTKSKILPVTASAWPLRALQFQVAMVYLATFWAKSEGATWWNGSAVYLVSQIADFKRFPIPFLYSSWWTIKVATWGTLAFEGLFPILIWFRETRLWILIIGVIFHLGIEWHLVIPLFQWLTIATYCVFLEKEDLKKIQLLFKFR